MRRVNSAGVLQDDEDGIARWKMIYLVGEPADGVKQPARVQLTPERVKLYRSGGSLNRNGIFVRDEVYKYDRGGRISAIDFEFFTARGPASLTAYDAALPSVSDMDAGAVVGKSRVTRHNLKFDDNGCVIERRYMHGSEHGPEPCRNALGSFGQSCTHSAEGLITRRAAIDQSGNEITLTIGIRAFVFKHDSTYSCICEERIGGGGSLFNSRDGYAYLTRAHDRWGNEIRLAYFRVDGTRATHKDGWHATETRYDKRGLRSVERISISMASRCCTKTAMPATGKSAINTAMSCKKPITAWTASLWFT